jgi:hypothetical protein
VTERSSSTRSARFFRFWRGREPRFTDERSSGSIRWEDASTVVRRLIADHDDADTCCEEVTQTIDALRAGESVTDLKRRAPLLEAIWLGAEGVAWERPRDGDSAAGLEFAVGVGTAEPFLAWMLFFACFGGVDARRYEPGLALFRQEIVGEVRDPYDIAAVYSHLEAVAQRYGMPLSDGQSG